MPIIGGGLIGPTIPVGPIGPKPPKLYTGFF